MKVSFNWLKDYIDIKIPLPKLVDLLTTRSFEVATVEKVGSDYVMDIEVLPNRAHDCLSHIGVAREISALLETKLKIKETKVKEDKKSSVKNYLAIKIEEPELCRRYVGRVILGVKVGPSPKWLKDRLEAIGQKSINNIVDAANYAMFEYGQPLHVFDLDKIESENSKPRISKKIIVRKAKKGEKIITLDTETYDLNENVLVIADERELLAIAGIKGGRKAEIDKNTKNIILESANFEPANIRRTSRALGLRTESSLRFEHEISSRLAEVAIERLAELIAAVAGGKIAKGKIDEYIKKPIPYFIAIRPCEVEKILGTEIQEKEIVEIFKRLGFEAKKISPLEIIFKTAKGLLGKLYKYGASVSFDAPNLFDCSSFVSFCFSRAGIQLHRLSVEQFIYDGVAADKTELLPGDLVFSKGKKPYFYKETPKGVGHVGIYLGNGKVVHASSSRGVVIEPL
ncbi:MAG: Phenylalanine-tRNA ligase beta subunit, partial [Candidatus Azambacteria bacterium GW2011_GWB2_46_37]